MLYARVSSRKQQDDLERQIAYLRSKEPNAKLIIPIGGSLDFKRKGHQTLLEHHLQGNKLTTVVAHRDRLARLVFDRIERLVERNGGQIVVLSNLAHTSPKDELV